MSKKKKKKRLLDSRFYRVYFTVLAAALVAILVFTVWLTGYLRDLESAQPVYVARDVAKLFEDGDYENLYRMDGSAEAIAEGDPAFYVENMRSIAAGKDVAWSEGFSENPDEHRYNVTLNGERFATFTLVPSGKTNRRGHRLWTLGSVQTHVAVEAPPEPEPTPEPVRVPVRITAPKGYAVAVDGEALSEGNATLTEKNLYEDDFLPEGVENPVMVTYDYAAGTEAPQVTVTDANGTPVSPAETGENTWTYRLREDENLKAQFSEAAYSLGQKIARYTSKDGSRDAIMQYCAQNSPARVKFKNLSNQYATPHSGHSFQNPAVTEFYPLADGCFTCRVTFDYLLKTRQGVRTDPTAYIFCIITNGKDAKLYNLLMG